MKANVNDKTERLILGNIIELRGNFIPIETEDGISYECDYYRTRNKNVTFEQLHHAEMASQAQAYLDATDWVIAQLGEYQMLGIDTPDRSDILAERERCRNVIRG